MGKKKTPAPASAKGRGVDLSLPNLSTTALRESHRRHLEAELGSKRPVRLAYANGARSITCEQALDARFRIIGPDGVRQSSGGILFPFSDGFAHLRCDEKPRNKQGDPCKYLTPLGCKFSLKVFGDGEPIIATEGWKDAFRIHLETGKTTVALPSVSAYGIIPPSVQEVVYDADAAHNPYVWGLLIRAGIANKAARIGFFPREVAGAKGGACEFFNNGGNWWEVSFAKPRAVLREIYKGWSADLRADFIRGNLRVLIRCMAELGYDPIDSELLLEQARKKVKATKEQVQALQQRYANSLKSDDAEPDEPEDTHSRVLEIKEVIGHEWRADYASETSFRRYTGTHWERLHGNDYALRAIEGVYDLKGWVIREKPTVSSDLAGFRRAIGNVVPPCRGGFIPFSNGMLRLSDKALLPHSPRYGNDYCLPYPWQGVDAPCDKFDAFLKDRLGDDDTVALIYAACFVALTGMQAKVFIEIIGGSDVGKSVVVACLEALVGLENRVTGSLAKLENPLMRFETIRYREARLAVFPESGSYSGSLEVLKAMTGRDSVPAELKGVNGAINFVFEGLVVVAGNNPIRVSDVSGAVHNRRRGVHITKVIPPSKQRRMLEQEQGRWVGELADQLPGLAAKVLSLSPSFVRQALRRDVRSLNRAKADLASLLKSDHLAQWADENLIWDPRIPYSRIGKIDADPAQGWLLPHYRKWVEDRENFRAYGQNNFKSKLVALLRDALDLPLPPDGDPTYSDRVRGSLLPHVRLRHKEDGDAKGIIEWASLRRAGQLTEQACDVETSVSDGRDEGDETPQPAIGDEKYLLKASRHQRPVFQPRKKGCEP
ncbi:DUF5906 domain-containing protein [Synechococcus sp. A10-1-5-9]|uniref:DUF5906 domain-containing protein n=1 Tax=Synechococcus sp. A10-1-5-9 TaxID=3392295 RepID=UPI0039E7777A